MWTWPKYTCTMGPLVKWCLVLYRTRKEHQSIVDPVSAPVIRPALFSSFFFYSHSFPVSPPSLNKSPSASPCPSRCSHTPSISAQIFVGKHLLVDIFIPQPEVLCTAWISTLTLFYFYLSDEKHSEEKLLLAWNICFRQNHDAHAKQLYGAPEVSQSRRYCVHLCNM